MRSLNPTRLALQANITLLDDEDALNKALDTAILAREFELPLLEEDDEEEYPLPPLARSSIRFPLQVVPWDRLRSSQWTNRDAEGEDDIEFEWEKY